MNTLQDLVSQITDEKTLKKWKAIARQKILKYASVANPFKGIKPTDYYLYIDSKTLSFGLILHGVKPNAGAIRGFSAPVNQRVDAPKPIHVKLPFGWRTVDTERKTGSYLGVKQLDTSYYGVSGTPNEYFGLKRKGKVEAFGIADNTAVPVYSDFGFVEWLTQDSIEELESILIDAGYTALDGKKIQNN